MTSHPYHHATAETLSRYIDLGWWIFPLRRITSLNGTISCTCPPENADGKRGATECCAIGKHPIEFWTKLTEQPSLEKVLSQLKNYPTNGWAMNVGPSRIVGLDVDARNGGLESWAALESKYGPLPVTFRTFTGHGDGSFHAYFDGSWTHPVLGFNTTGEGKMMARVELATGIEAFAGQHIMVLPPSPHKSGGTYKIDVNAKVAPTPPVIREPAAAALATMLAKTKQEEESRRRTFYFENVNRPLEEGGKAVSRARAYLNTIEPAVSGGGGSNQTFYAACRTLLGFNLEFSDALGLLEEWNSRCQPPWSFADLKRKLCEVEKTQADATRGELLNAERPDRAFTDEERRAYGARFRAGIDAELARYHDAATYSAAGRGIFAVDAFGDLHGLHGERVAPVVPINRIANLGPAPDPRNIEPPADLPGTPPAPTIASAIGEMVEGMAQLPGAMEEVRRIAAVDEPPAWFDINAATERQLATDRARWAERRAALVVDHHPAMRELLAANRSRINARPAGRNCCYWSHFKHRADGNSRLGLTLYCKQWSCCKCHEINELSHKTWQSAIFRDHALSDHGRFFTRDISLDDEEAVKKSIRRRAARDGEVCKYVAVIVHGGAAIRIISASEFPDSRRIPLGEAIDLARSATESVPTTLRKHSRPIRYSTAWRMPPPPKSGLYEPDDAMNAVQALATSRLDEVGADFSAAELFAACRRMSGIHTLTVENMTAGVARGLLYGMTENCINNLDSYLRIGETENSIPKDGWDLRRDPFELSDLADPDLSALFKRRSDATGITRTDVFGDAYADDVPEPAFDPGSRPQGGFRDRPRDDDLMRSDVRRGGTRRKRSGRLTGERKDSARFCALPIDITRQSAYYDSVGGNETTNAKGMTMTMTTHAPTVFCTAIDMRRIKAALGRAGIYRADEDRLRAGWGYRIDAPSHCTAYHDRAEVIFRHCSNAEVEAIIRQCPPAR